MTNRNGDSVSPPGEIAPKPGEHEIRHLRAKEEGEVVTRVFQWGEEEEGKWIQADDEDCRNLYAEV